MRISCCICVLVATLLACQTAPKAQNTANAAPPPAFSLSWDKKMVELGPVKKGETRTMFFEFTNTGTENIQIEAVAACECTTVDYPRGAIAPGAKGRLDVVFDSKEKDAAETIDIDVIFKNTDAQGHPRIERVSYKFDLTL